MNVKRLLAVASLAVSTTAAADTPRLLKNGRPACGNVPKKTAMGDRTRCTPEPPRPPKQVVLAIAAATRDLLRIL